MSLVADRTYTPEDLLTMPDGDRFELVNGQLVEKEMSFLSSYVAGQLFRRMDEVARSQALGWVVPEGATYQCFPQDPTMVRKADVSFILAKRFSADEAQESGHTHTVPDIVAEVVSPNDLAYEVDDKVRDYLTAGVKLVWVVNPQAKLVKVYRAQGKGTILRDHDELTGDDILPDFRVPVAELFVLPGQVSMP